MSKTNAHKISKGIALILAIIIYSEVRYTLTGKLPNYAKTTMKIEARGVLHQLP